MSREKRALSLLCRVDTRLCALPLDDVIETMRPLAIEPFAGSPTFVRGVSIIRGNAVPVVDAALLLGAIESHPSRLVTIVVGERTVALAVDEVLGVEAIPDEAHPDLPPLLDDTNADSIAEIGALDSELLVVLRHARLVPESVWALLAPETSSS